MQTLIRTLNDIDRDVHVIVERIRELGTALALASARKREAQWGQDRLREMYLMVGQRDRLMVERREMLAEMATTS